MNPIISTANNQPSSNHLPPCTVVEQAQAMFSHYVGLPHQKQVALRNSTTCQLLVDGVITPQEFCRLEDYQCLALRKTCICQGLRGQYAAIDALSFRLCFPRLSHFQCIALQNEHIFKLLADGNMTLSEFCEMDDQQCQALEKAHLRQCLQSGCGAVSCDEFRRYFPRMTNQQCFALQNEAVFKLLTDGDMTLSAFFGLRYFQYVYLGNAQIRQCMREGFGVIDRAEFMRHYPLFSLAQCNALDQEEIFQLLASGVIPLDEFCRLNDNQCMELGNQTIRGLLADLAMSSTHLLACSEQQFLALRYRQTRNDLRTGHLSIAAILPGRPGDPFLFSSLARDAINNKLRQIFARAASESKSEIQIPFKHHEADCLLCLDAIELDVISQDTIGELVAANSELTAVPMRPIAQPNKHAIQPVIFKLQATESVRKFRSTDQNKSYINPLTNTSIPSCDMVSGPKLVNILRNAYPD